MRVYALNVTEFLDDCVFEKLLLRVSNEKQEKIKRFIKPDDAKRSLMAEILLRDVICDELYIENEKVEFGTNEFSKPYLRGNENFHFNISHSGDWVVCVTDSSPVGIDVEKIKPVDIDIAKRFFSKEEYESLMERGEEERLAFFYDLWTLKESYIKAVGKGLSVPLDSFSISVGNDISMKTESGSSDWFFRQYEIDKDYKFSVCAAHNSIPKEAEIKAFKNFRVNC